MSSSLRWFAAALAVSACLVAASPRAQDEQGVLAPIVVARVGETPILRATLEAAVVRAGSERLGTEELKQRARAEVLGQLVNEQLLRQAVERDGKNATDVEIDAFLSRLKLGRPPSELDAVRAGRDEKTFRGHVALEIGVKKLIASRITQESIEAAFREHRKELDGTLVRVSHILLRPDAGVGEASIDRLTKKASAIRSEIVQGSLAFAEAARRHSAGPSRRQGGDLGFLPRTGVMVEEFSSKVFSLGKGEVSKPFVTPFGVHVATVTAIKPGTVPDERIRSQIEQFVAQKLLREILDRERAETQIFYGPGVAHFERNPDDPSAAPELVVEPLPVGR